MKSAGSLTLWLLLILFAPVLQAQQGAVRMELGAAEISIGESVTLTVVANGVDGELDLSALEQNFEVVVQSNNTGSRTSIIGGRTTVVQSRSWVLELTPRAMGNFVLPAVRVGQDYSNTLSLTVRPAPTGAERGIYVEATADTNTPWVQSQVLLTVRVYQAIEIVEGSLGAPEGEALNVEQLGEDKRFEEVRDGRRYAVTERRFAVFPQRSGKLVIDPVRLTVSVPTEPGRLRGFFTPTKNLRRQTESIELDVRARPASGGSWWFPSQGVTLEEMWSSDPEKATVDQPLTRTLVLRAIGATATQLPRIERPDVQGLSIYAEEPVSASGHSDQGLISEQRFNWAIIPESVGEQVLPAIAIEWFNTITGQLETVELDARRLRVSPSAKNATQTPSATAGNAASSADTSAAALSGLSENSGPVDGPRVDGAAANTSDALSAETDVRDSGSAKVADRDHQADANGLVVPDLVHDAGSAVKPSADFASDIKRWQMVSAGLLFGWMVTLAWMIMQYRSRRKHVGGYTTSMVNRLGAVRDGARQLHSKMAPLAEVELSCRENDPNAVSQSILRWAARQFPDQPPRSLSALADRLGHHSVSVDLRALDADLYRATPGPAREAKRYENLASEIRQAMRDAPATKHAEMSLPGEDPAPRGKASSDSHGLPEL